MFAKHLIVKPQAVHGQGHFGDHPAMDLQRTTDVTQGRIASCVTGITNWAEQDVVIDLSKCSNQSTKVNLEYLINHIACHVGKCINRSDVTRWYGYTAVDDNM